MSGPAVDLYCERWLETVDFDQIYPFAVTPFNVRLDFDAESFLRSRVEFILNTGNSCEDYLEEHYTRKSLAQIRNEIPAPRGYFTTFYLEEVAEDPGQYACWVLLVDKDGLSEAEARIMVNEKMAEKSFDEIFNMPIIYYNRMNLDRN